MANDAKAAEDELLDYEDEEANAKAAAETTGEVQWQILTYRIVQCYPWIDSVVFKRLESQRLVDFFCHMQSLACCTSQGERLLIEFTAQSDT
jgi:hypothetical protein